MDSDLMKMIFILGLFAVMLLAGCCGTTSVVEKSGGSTGQQNYTATTNPTNTNTNANIEDGEIGKIYTISYLGSEYEVTLTKTEFVDSGNPYVPGTYLMSYFEIRNVGSTSQYLAPDIYAIGPDTEKYDKTIYMGMDTETYSKTLDFIKELPPNTKMSGWVAIKVPSDVTNVDLYFEYSGLSSKPYYIKYSVAR
jgi:hypothetical protein